MEKVDGWVDGRSRTVGGVGFVVEVAHAPGLVFLMYLVAAVEDDVQEFGVGRHVLDGLGGEVAREHGQVLGAVGVVPGTEL